VTVVAVLKRLLTQKRFVQTTVDVNNLASNFTGFLSKQEVDRLSLIGRRDWLLSQ